jgi:hypothetical protein
MRRPPGEIVPDRLYTVPELRARADFGDFTWREARTGGLRIRKVGRKMFVLGKDFIDYVLTASEKITAGAE